MEQRLSVETVVLESRLMELLLVVVVVVETLTEMPI
jgi:hypothetical protein